MIVARPGASIWTPVDNSSSTHDTGIGSALPAPTSTVTLRMRFCFAPSSSSPS
jgi:hypothetical protein